MVLGQNPPQFNKTQTNMMFPSQPL